MELSVIQYSILLECSRFLAESNGIPLYKTIKNDGVSEDKKKIRLKSDNKPFHSDIDKAVKFDNMVNRSLTTHTNINYLKHGYDLYYVFIPDQFNCIYTKENLNINFETIFQKLSENNISDSFESLLKYSYGFDDLSSAITVNDEIIFYNIPYYYCILSDKPYDEVLKFNGHI